MISAKGRNGTAELLKIIAKDEDDRISGVARLSLTVLARQYAAITIEIGTIEKQIHALHRSCEESRRLAEIPGVGPIVATALIAEVGDWTVFSSGRSLAAWIGLVPRQHSTGGKDRLGRISKQGNRHLRWLLVAGAMAVIRYARQRGTKRLWLVRLMGRMWMVVRIRAKMAQRKKLAWPLRTSQPLLAVERLVANDGWVTSRVKAVSRRRRGPQARLCVGHVRQLGGESPLCNLMEVKH